MVVGVLVVVVTVVVVVVIVVVAVVIVVDLNSLGTPDQTFTMLCEGIIAVWVLASPHDNGLYQHALHLARSRAP